MFKTGDVVRLIRLTADDKINHRHYRELGTFIGVEPDAGLSVVDFGDCPYYVYHNQIEAAEDAELVELLRYYEKSSVQLPLKESILVSLRRLQLNDILCKPCDCTGYEDMTMIDVIDENRDMRELLASIKSHLLYLLDADIEGTMNRSKTEELINAIGGLI